ncbi:MAG: SGNH/GDSL hydrolase family protein [Aeromicrobium sp.]
MRSRLPLVAAIAAIAFTAAACSSSSDSVSDSSADSKPASGPHYVALGDSFTAGPDIFQLDARSGACARSTRNYPHLIAEKIDAASFVDVSCSGATSDNVLAAAPIGEGEPIPAQLDAVEKDTTLVTVGIGGNDDDLFSTLASACTAQGTACEDYLKDKLPGVLGKTRTRVASVLSAVEARAPKAEVILVGYLSVSPPASGCEALGGDALDTRGVSAGEKSIDAMMQAAATDAGATYVSMNTVATGHDACAGSAAWTNGIAPAELGDGAALHPREAGMKATADEVETVIG